MSRSIIRNIILLAFISLAGIIATQIFWIKKAIDLKEQQFNHRAYVALKSVADRLIQDSKFNVQLDGINKKASMTFSTTKTAIVAENEVLLKRLKCQARTPPPKFPGKIQL